MSSHRSEWRRLPEKSEEGGCGEKEGEAPGSDTSKILSEMLHDTEGVKDAILDPH